MSRPGPDGSGARSAPTRWGSGRSLQWPGRARRGNLARAARRQDGFALLIVLWTMSLLTLVGSVITAAGRSEARLAANLRGAAVAEAAADAAVFTALFHLLDGSNARWAADGMAHPLRLSRAEAVVSIVDLSGRVDLNTASLQLLGALLRETGLDQRTASALAAAIADWRSPSRNPLPLGAKAGQYLAAGKPFGPPNEAFRTLDELGLVLGMTPAILAALTPHVALHLDGNPDPAQADPLVLQALADAAAAGAAVPPDIGNTETAVVVEITARARSSDGGHYTRRAMLRVNAGSSSGADRAPYEVISWERANG